MKIKSFIISILLGIGFFSSCVDEVNFGDAFLEKQPGVDVTKDTIFNKAENSRRFLWDTYSKMYYGLPVYWNDVDGKMNMGMFEALSDCWHSHLNWDGVNRKYYTGSYNANEEDSSSDTKFGFGKENVWQGVRASWIFIENVDRVPDMDAAEKARLKAEAKVIIASRYFDLFRHYGGLPIVDHAFTKDEDFTNPRATVENTVKFMVDLLDEASAVLPWVLESSESSNWDGRFTKAAAMGLKCKILLFAASPLFNDNVPYCTEGKQEAVTQHHVWYGSYKPEVWADLLTACETFFQEVQSQGQYKLYEPTGATASAYRTAFRNAYTLRGSGWDNPEMLISTRVRYTYSGSPWNYYFPQSCKQGALTPTQEFVEMFTMADGTPFDWNDPIHVTKMFSERDPRLFETILVNNATFQGRQAELWVGGREAQRNPAQESGEYATGYGNYKYILDYSSSNNKPTLWPYLRLAEVHLIYAEALMKGGRHGDAVIELDRIRARVGLQGLAVSNPTKNYNDDAVLLDAILNERACELGLEDVRFFDMIRHKRADLFQKKLHGLKTYRADGLEESWSDKPAGERPALRPSTFTYETFELTNASRAWWRSFSPKWYLSAFPSKEVNKDYGLTQNPGW